MSTYRLSSACAPASGAGRFTKRALLLSAVSLTAVLAAPFSSAWAACTTVTTDTTISADSCYSWQSGNLVVDGLTFSGSDKFIARTGTDADSLTIDSGQVIEASGMSDIFLDLSSGTKIDSIINNGTISNNFMASLANGGSIGKITNNGQFGTLYNWNTGSIDSIYNYGTMTIRNSGALDTLLNGQSGLQNYTNAPRYYITYFSSASSYGSVVFKSLNTYTLSAYGVAWKSGVTLTAGTTYTAVITSDSALTVPTGVLTLNGATYHLVAEDANNLVYDLVIDSFGSTSSGVYAATTAQSNSPGYNAAKVIDGNSNLSDLFSGVSGDAAISKAVSQTLPLLTGGQSVAIQNTLSGMNQVIEGRQDSATGLSSGDETISAVDRHFWVKPFGSWADQGDSGGVSGYSATSYGSVFGADVAVTDRDRIGAAFTYARSNVNGNSSDARQDSTVDTFDGAVYGSHQLDLATQINYQVDFGAHRNVGQRDIAFADDTAHSNYWSWSGHAGASIAHSFDLGAGTSLTPSAHLDYTLLHNDSYHESGAGDLNLNVDADTSQQLIPSVDVRLSHNLFDNLTATVNAGGGYDVLNEQASITSAFAGAPNEAFVTKGIDPSPWSWHAGAGLIGRLSDTAEISANYDYEGRSGFSNQTASVKIRWAL